MALTFAPGRPPFRSRGRTTCVSIARLGQWTHAPPLERKISNITYPSKISICPTLATLRRIRPNPLPENAPAGGYSYTSYAASLFLKKHGVPLESYLPYVGGGSYENTNEPADNPRVTTDTYNPATQRVINDFNLDPANLPLSALQQGNHRINAFMGFGADSLGDLSYYKAVLKAGYEIIFATAIYSPDPNTSNNIWEPGPKRSENLEGYHAMLMVGYDDSRQAFIIKNSWDYDDASINGFTFMSYDFVTGGYLTDALYITGVVNPPELDMPEQLFLGRWNLDHDGWKGILDLYRLPGMLDINALGGQLDRRIGTYFHSDGTVYRVNGSMNRNKIEFYIDFNKPDLEYGDYRVKKFPVTSIQEITIISGLMTAPTRKNMASTRQGKAI